MSMWEMDSLGDWAGDFFTGDWKNAMEANPWLTAGIPALATAGIGAAALGGAGGVGALLGGAGAVEGAGGVAALGGAADVGMGTTLGASTGIEALIGSAGSDALVGSAAGDALASGSGIEALLSGAAGDSVGSIGLVGAEYAPATEAFASAAGEGGTPFLNSLLGGAKDLGKGAWNSVANNPLGVGAAAIGLGMSMSQGQNVSPNQDALQNSANALSAQGQQFMQFLQNGTLPPGLQAAVNQATAAAKARIISNHAKNGMSTDPTANSALAQELAAADRNALIAVAKEGEILFKAGAAEVGLANQIYERLIGIEMQQNANMGKAIASFAQALSGPAMRKAA